MLEINLGTGDSVLKRATATQSMNVGIKLFSPKPPYVIDKRPEGDIIVIFSDHFIEQYRKALSLNCVADMTDAEKELYFGFASWTKDKENYDISQSSIAELVFEALDQWTIDELMGNPHPDYVTCGD